MRNKPYKHSTIINTSLTRIISGIATTEQDFDSDPEENMPLKQSNNRPRETCQRKIFT